MTRVYGGVATVERLRAPTTRSAIRCQAQVSEDRFAENGATKDSGMRNFPRRGGRLALECSCAGRVVDWALTPWGDRLYGVLLLSKGESCRIARHASGTSISARVRVGTRPPQYYDTRTR